MPRIFQCRQARRRIRPYNCCAIGKRYAAAFTIAVAAA
jgi:hypothetical protein